MWRRKSSQLFSWALTRVPYRFLLPEADDHAVCCMLGGEGMLVGIFICRSVQWVMQYAGMSILSSYVLRYHRRRYLHRAAVYFVSL